MQRFLLVLITAIVSLPVAWGVVRATSTEELSIRGWEGALGILLVGVMVMGGIGVFAVLCSIVLYLFDRQSGWWRIVIHYAVDLLTVFFLTFVLLGVLSRAHFVQLF